MQLDFEVEDALMRDVSSTDLIANIVQATGKRYPLPPPQLSDNEETPQVFAPFTYFGGKKTIADLVWQHLGHDVYNYVEPFFGSGAVLLARPNRVNLRTRMETVNDFNCWLSNFWRAVAHDPERVAFFADMPLNEVDMHAWHRKFCYKPFIDKYRERMLSDTDFYDAELAGRWVWGMSAWLSPRFATIEITDKNKRPQRSIPSLGNLGQGIFASRYDLHEGFKKLFKRLHRVRICSGDWSRMTTPAVTYDNGLTAMFFDPPYDGFEEFYAPTEESISAKVRQWCIENGDNPKLRIALCGYDTEHNDYMPETWKCVPWKSASGFANTRKNGVNENGKRERIWFSPHCLNPDVKKQTLLELV